MIFRIAEKLLKILQCMNVKNENTNHSFEQPIKSHLLNIQ